MSHAFAAILTGGNVIACRVCNAPIEQPEEGNVVWEVKCRNPHYNYSWVHKACTATLDAMTMHERGEILDAWEMERFLSPETDMFLPYVTVPWKERVIRVVQKRWGGERTSYVLQKGQAE